jgi:RHS repeat-associated protein
LSYTYDGAGNLKTMTENGITITLNYPSPNYLNELQSTSVGGVTKTTYAYDGDGNMVSRNGTAQTFTYNFMDQMVKAKVGPTTETNVFDGLGRRISRTVGGVTTSWAYIGDKVLYEQNMTNGQVTGRIDHIYADGFQVAEVVNGVTYYPVQNYVGSTVKVMSNSVPPGTSFSASYYPYGRISVSVNTLHETLRFTEMPYDSLTGLYFMGTRFYDPTIGRFVQMATSAGVLPNPLSLNRYAYAGDNPMSFSDRSGFDWWTDAQNWWNSQPAWAKAGMAVGAGIAIGVAICVTIVGCFGPAEAAGVSVAGIGLGDLAVTGSGLAVGTAAAVVENVLGDSINTLLTRAFPNGFKMSILSEDTPVFRYFGGFVGKIGSFFTPEYFADSDIAIQRLSLEETGNTAEQMVPAVLRAGTVVFQGTTAGGAWQYLVVNAFSSEGPAAIDQVVWGVPRMVG